MLTMANSGPMFCINACIANLHMQYPPVSNLNKLLFHIHKLYASYDAKQSFQNLMIPWLSCDLQWMSLILNLPSMGSFHFCSWHQWMHLFSIAFLKEKHAEFSKLRCNNAGRVPCMKRRKERKGGRKEQKKRKRKQEQDWNEGRKWRWDWRKLGFYQKDWQKIKIQRAN